MTQTKQARHTAGPWKYHLGRGANPRFHVQAVGGYQIASTTELTTPRTAKLASDFDENEVREANARLLASAPELLEALQSELDALNVWICAPNIPDDVFDGMQISRDKIKAAIKKAHATGE